MAYPRRAAPAANTITREWPRTYRVGPATRLLLGGVGVVLVLGALALAGLAAWDATERLRVLIALVALFLALLGGAALLALCSRVVLSENAIEFVGLGHRRRFLKAEIVGWRVIPLQHGQRRLVLEFRMGRRPFKADWSWKEDEAFTAWLEELPDLDAVDRARLEAELLKAPELGRSEEERRASLRQARIVARVATGVSVTAAAWGFVRPQPYGLAVGILTAIPVAIVVLLFFGRGAYSLEGARNDPRPNLVFALLAPGLVLMVRSVLDLSTIDWQLPLLWTLPVSLVAALALRACDPRAPRRWYVVPLFALMMAPWAGGSLTLGNAVLDRAQGETFHARVLDKRISRGKHTSYYLELEPWGPVADEDEVDVGRKAYQRIQVGDVVCPRLRRGALGFRWYRIEACDEP